jgi:protein-L-isoaspartate(D-aspartate) O-methyltransferase
MIIDDVQYQVLRQRLVKQLRQKFAFDERVLTAIGKIPRQLFVDKGLEHLAYEDRPLPIAAQQTISQPYTVAMQSHLLEIKKWDKVLEIGTGCGYQAAVLAELGATVYSIERQKELFVQAKAILERLQYRVDLFYGDGYEGKSIFAPYKKIIVTCGAPSVPPQLLAQLDVGGRMVIPVGAGSQIMQVIDRISETECRTTQHGNYSFVPMLGGVAAK